MLPNKADKITKDLNYVPSTLDIKYVTWISRWIHYFLPQTWLFSWFDIFWRQFLFIHASMWCGRIMSGNISACMSSDWLHVQSTSQSLFSLPSDSLEMPNSLSIAFSSFVVVFVLYFRIPTSHRPRDRSYHFIHPFPSPAFPRYTFRKICRPLRVVHPAIGGLLVRPALGWLGELWVARQWRGIVKCSVIVVHL